jgi:hypothetical protein
MTMQLISAECKELVIPAKAGIQKRGESNNWVPALVPLCGPGRNDDAIDLCRM